MKFKFLLPKSHFIEGIYNLRHTPIRKLIERKYVVDLGETFDVETEDSSTCKRI